MARRPFPLIAGVVAALVLSLVLGPIPLLLMRGGGHLSVADLAALRFTLAQAALSALLSVGLAIPIARALARRRFAGRDILIAMMGAPFLMPVLVVVLGVITIFGSRGWLADIGIPMPSPFGFQGVVLAHLFLNLPLAVRMTLQGWQAIPAERLRLAASLGFDPPAVWLHLERPMLRSVVPGAVLAVFLVCLTSFTIALTLGGGPRATTVELAIYQAIRFDFDLPRAALLALVQFGICAVAVAGALLLTLPAGFGAGLDRTTVPIAPAGWRRQADAALLFLAAAFVALPMTAALVRGLPGVSDMPVQVWPALLRSLIVAILSALLSVAAALALAMAVAQGAWRRFDLVAMLPLASSSLVLGTGLFLVVFPFVSPVRVALPVTILVNATLALPFAYRLLLPDAANVQAGFGRLAGSLGIAGWPYLRLIVLPRLRRPLGFALGVAAALSMGDLGAIALFAGDKTATLPLVVQRLMGAYRMEAAAAATLLLMVASFALFWMFDRWGRRDVDA
jgi:thiamine transport system permease protein